MKKISVLIGLFLTLLATSAFAELNLDDNGVALQGYDAVSYFDSAPQPGDAGIAVNHAGATWLFANEANKVRFVENPEAFMPAYGGWCAWAMINGSKVKVNPKRYKIIDGVNYLFYSTLWADTLDKWNESSQKNGEQSLIRSADAQWQKLQN